MFKVFGLSTFIAYVMVTTPILLGMQNPALKKIDDNTYKYRNTLLTLAADDICEPQDLDCIVNPTNQHLSFVVGIPAYIQLKAGGKSFQDTCEQALTDYNQNPRMLFQPGHALSTTVGKLTHLQKIVHAAQAIEEGDERLLKIVYENTLKEVISDNIAPCRRVGLPPLGIKKQVTDSHLYNAIPHIFTFIDQNPDSLDEIRLTMFHHPYNEVEAAYNFMKYQNALHNQSIDYKKQENSQDLSTLDKNKNQWMMQWLQKPSVLMGSGVLVVGLASLALAYIRYSTKAGQPDPENNSEMDTVAE
jgi:O-acetyl-ADP-ribose deacetylase (regulator of RNase III)